MPSSISETMGRMVIAIDTSGSIGSEEIRQFLGELKMICESVLPEHVSLLYWDTEVCQHEKYDRDQLDGILLSTKPGGGGGTDINCVFNFVKEHKLDPACIVVLTDGHTPWPGNISVPTLFGITTDVVAPIGKTIKI